MILMNHDYSGFIKSISAEKGYGFVTCTENKKDYYFRTSHCQYQAVEGDAVAFWVADEADKPHALALRKIYLNSSNIKLYSRVNRHHIHVALDQILPAIIDRITNRREAFIELTHDFKFIIGKSTCVETNSQDTILYAIRNGRVGHSRFVLNRLPEDTTSVFAAFKRTQIGYMIVTIFRSSKAEREPFDPLASNSSLRFWRNHALIYNPDLIIKGSECSSCPWVLNQPSICTLK